MLAQIQSQRQQIKILPQQIHLLNFFFLNSQGLQQRIKNELEENPFLDAHEDKDVEECDTKSSKDIVQDFESSEESMYDDRSDYKAEYQNYFDAGININSPIVYMVTLKENAKQQLQLLEISAEERIVAEYIVDSLTPQGLLDRTLDELADDMSFHFKKVVETEAIRKGLTIVQSLDPIGIGTCSIKECLLVQLRNMSTQEPDVIKAILLLKNHYTDLLHRQFEKIQHILKIDKKQMKVVLNLIGSLKFYPINETYQHDPKQTIIPDFKITTFGDNVQVGLCSSKARNVFVNETLYDQLADHISSKDSTASQYVKTKLSSAKWFVDAVKQREHTMLRIMRCIVSMQHEYFIAGDVKYLKPMILKNVAEKLGLDIATISRITGNKYADTPFGLIFLKKLFSEGITDKQGDVISNKVIKSILGDTIESENKKQPYTDQQLVNLLSLKGLNIARRTVAKYRDRMHVPTAQIRAVWA
jgi:RNA polymerase sigma-54 factor